ncbi:MAG: hypothetical protein AAGA30_03070, partial [Planctomycetota bacterium]
VNRDVRWIEHRSASTLASGAPLLNQSGSFVALNTSLSLGDDRLLALPANWIEKLRSSASGDLTPLPLGDLSLQTDENAGESMNMTLPVIALDSENRSLSEQLNSLGKQCETFGWRPRKDVEHLAFQRFVSAFSQLDRLSDQALDDRKDIQLQLELWKTKVSEVFGGGANWSREQQIAFNQKQQALVSDEPACAGFVFVKYSAIESPRVAVDGGEKMDSVILEFKGTDQTIITNLDRRWPALPPDSPWFVMGMTLPKKVMLSTRNQQEQKLIFANLNLVIRSN